MIAAKSGSVSVSVRFCSIAAHDKCDLGQGAASKVGKQGFNHVLVRQRESDKPTAFYSAFLLVARYGPTPEPPHKNTLNARDGK